MNRVAHFVRAVSPQHILAAATACTIIGLTFMVLPNFVQSPLLIIASVTLAHAAGLMGVLLFALSVLREVFQVDRATSEIDESD